MIIHATITGFGGTIVELNVMDYKKSIKQLEKLISLGFNKKQIVLRLDPMIPTTKGIRTAESVLKEASKLGIKRVRFSFCDLYPHVKKRFKEAGLTIPYDFAPTSQMVKNALSMLLKYENIYELESCAENTKYRLGCKTPPF